MTKKTRLAWIDIAKGYGILLVILAHIYKFEYIYSFHLPLFFIISGYTHNSTNVDFYIFLRKKFRTVVIPYFSLGTVLLLYSFITYAKNNYETSQYVQLFVKFILQERLWTLWFLSCLFVLNIYFYWLVRLFRDDLRLIGAVVAALSVLMLIYYKSGGGAWIWNADASIIALTFYFSGYFFKRYNVIDFLHKKGAKEKFYIMAFCFALQMSLLKANIYLTGESLEMFANSYAFFPLTYIVAVLGALFIIMLSEYDIVPLVKYIGKNSIIYFAWHQTLVFSVIYFLYKRFDLFGGVTQVDLILKVVVTMLLTIAALTVVTATIRRLELNFFTGLK